MSAEMRERTSRVGDGIAESKGEARQSHLAWEGKTNQWLQVNMEEVLRADNVREALRRVVANKGACGVDDMSVDELRPYLKSNWKELRRSLLEGDYRPQPVLRVDIPKTGGKGTRMLGIPTVLDRFIQQSLLQVLQRAYDPTFSESSYGFRPGRSAHFAILQAREHMIAGYRWVVDMDLEKFFDRVNHDVLMSRLVRRISDKRILRLIRRYLQAGMMEGGVSSPRSEGTPQGGPLSPLLSNILLDELDKELERRGHSFVRYADDCNIYVQSRAAGERVLASLDNYLSSVLKLKVNREKSAVDRPWNRKFLGYTVTTNRRPRLKVAPESVKRFKGNIREVLRRGRGRSIRRVAAELLPKIRGWVSYFRLADVKVTFELLDQWLRRCLRCLLWRQWKRPKTRMKRMMALGLPKHRAWKSANNGRGPWWNAGASHMSHSIPTRYLSEMGLLSLQSERLRLTRSV